MYVRNINSIIRISEEEYAELALYIITQMGGGKYMGRYEVKSNSEKTVKKTETVMSGCFIFSCKGECHSSCIGTASMKPIVSSMGKR